MLRIHGKGPEHFSSADNSETGGSGGGGGGGNAGILGEKIELIII